MTPSERYQKLIEECVAQARMTRVPEASRVWLTIGESYQLLRQLEELVELGHEYQQVLAV
jgi:hypothetical protein